jgi:hypothetical protein
MCIKHQAPSPAAVAWLALRPRRRQRIRGGLEAPERGVVAADVELVTNGEGGGGLERCNAVDADNFSRNIFYRVHR